MANITLSIPDELHEKMKEHSELRWSEVARQAIQKKIDDLELMNNLVKKSRLTKKDVSRISKSINRNVSKKMGFR